MKRFSQKLDFFFLVFPMWAAEADTQLAFKASAHSTTCVWFYFPLTLSSTAVTARSVDSYRAETFTRSDESPTTTIPPPKNPYFEDIKKVLMGNTHLQGPVAYSQMNYGARLQLKI